MTQLLLILKRTFKEKRRNKMEKFKLKNITYYQFELRTVETIKTTINLIKYSMRISVWDSDEARRRLDIWLMIKTNLREKFRKK